MKKQYHIYKHARDSEVGVIQQQKTYYPCWHITLFFRGSWLVSTCTHGGSWES